MPEVTEQELRKNLVSYGEALYNRDLVGGAEGNLTVRLPDGNILASPAGAIKGFMSPEDLAVVKLSGESIGSFKPSSEIALHLRIYHEREDVRAVIHAHPIAATAFAAVGRTLPKQVLVEADLVLGDVPLVPYATPGTPTMGDAIAPLLPGRKAFLLQSHGAVTVGDSLYQAFIWMETLERCCRILVEAAALGGARQMPPEMIRWLEEF